MPTGILPRSGVTVHLGLARHPDRHAHERWTIRRHPDAVVDYTKVRSLQRFNTIPGFVFDQLTMGSCTANAGVGIAMACDAIDGNPVRVYSRMMDYYDERVILGTVGQDSGADVIDEFDVEQSGSPYGLILDSIWPYTPDPAAGPPAAAKNVQRYFPVSAYQPIAASQFRDGILTALDANQPVAIGLNWFNGWFRDFETGGLLTAKGMDYVAGGHAIWVIGYAPPFAGAPQGAIACVNSWNKTSPTMAAKYWSDFQPGYVLIPLDVFAMASVGADAYAAAPASSPPNPTPTPTPPNPTPTPPSPGCAIAAQTLCVNEANAWIAKYNAGTIGYDETLGAYEACVDIYQNAGTLPAGANDRPPAFPACPVAR